MKKTKIIVPALGMLLLSTAASVTGTVAWFSMNNFVTAEGMNVKAKAENGIVISNQSAASGQNVYWKESATSARTSTLEVRPTSTATGATWVHSTSNDASDENTGNDYELLTTTVDTTSGAGYADDNNHAGYDATDGEGYVADSVYYAMHSFYIKSSAEAITKPLYITNVKATLPTTQNSADLNKALRVLVRLSSDASTAKVYSPVYAASGYSVATTSGTFAAATKQAVTPIDASGTDGLIATASQSFLNTTIPASNATPLQIDIYLYFEGEDPNCISNNLTATLDSINVSVTFGTQTKTA